ncbi:hypothetical protein Rhopal_005368-T1 [Rhodotorula paludigena]|uniref:Chromate ion transporter n=1 Tax=Rhodotorula paludigena TaxID=86838 RepID=A0AAV5GQ88_9BASI|nr:hypothetical protein Rhopal_005368-T1 [Rhodotorula paludigena]
MASNSQDRRSVPLDKRLIETVRRYWDLGFISFGGPGVHVVILRKRFVDRLKWVDETTFTDLFSLGNALPGPGSTQLAFSLALVRNGTLAGFLAFLLWSLPGAAGMAALGAGVRDFPERLPPIVLALLTGLNAAAVGLIALAAYQLSKAAITDSITRLLVLGSASFGICYHAPWMYPVLVVAGGLSTLVYDVGSRRLASYKLRRARAPVGSTPSNVTTEALSVNAHSQDIELEPIESKRTVAAGDDQHRRAIADEAVPDRSTSLMVLNRKLAIVSGTLFAVFIVVIIVVRSQLDDPPRALDFFTNMVIAGVIIFGGGPVVVPLLRGYTVDNGWVESRDFLLGFAILQAFPGPNFNFAVYLGVLSLPSNPALGAVLGWLGIFSPGILLKLALLPLYHTWRKHAVAVSVLRGLNAAAVGLVYTAVWQLFLVGYIYTSSNPSATSSSASMSGPLTSDPFWGVVASAAFVASQWFKAPPAVTIAGGALAGMAWFGVVGEAGVTRQQLW